MKFFIFLISIFLFFFLCTSCSSCSSSIDDPLSKETVQDLLGEPISYKLVKRYNFGGFDLHGDIFIFYEYTLSGTNHKELINQEKIKNFPLFKKGYFEAKQLLDSSRAIKWKKLPVSGYVDSLIFSPLFSYQEVASKVNRLYLSDSTNFYSFISDRHLGNCAFLLLPKQERLYLVIKTN